MYPSEDNKTMPIYKDMGLEELNAVAWRYLTETPEEEIDSDFIVGIYEIIREKDSTTEYFQNLPTYNNLQRNIAESYKNSAKEYRRLYKGMRPRKSFAQILKYALPACVCFFVLLFAPIAYGNSFFQLLIDWGEEIATIRSFPISGNMHMPPDSDADYVSIAEALEQNRLPTQNIPTWIPEGFSMQTIEVSKTSNTLIIGALYTFGDNSIELSVMHLPNYQSDIIVEKSNDEEVEGTYISGGTEYYIMRNNNQMVAVWADGSCNYVLSGVVTEKEHKLMLDSIHR